MRVCLKAIIYTLILLTSGCASGAPADPDPTFTQGTSHKLDDVFPYDAVASLPDGKLLAASRTTITRFDASGAPDATFAGGRGFFEISSWCIALPDALCYRVGELTVQPDGKIVTLVTVWFLDRSSGQFQFELAVLRLESGGSPDPSFGIDGFARVPTTALRYSLSAPVVQTDGRLVLAGIQRPMGVLTAPYRIGLFRMLPDGTPDAEFGPDGGRLTDIDIEFGLAALLARPEGKLAVVARRPGPGATIVSGFLPDLSIDPGFGDSGIAELEGNGLDAPVSKFAFQPDGRIVAAGSPPGVNPPFGSVFARTLVVMRWLPSGRIDRSFGNHGSVMISAGEGACLAERGLLSAFRG